MGGQGRKPGNDIDGRADRKPGDDRGGRAGQLWPMTETEGEM